MSTPPVFDGPPVVQDAPTGLTIPGVPESISLQRIQEFIRSLGVDPLDLTAIRVDLKGVELEVWARDADGNLFTADDKNIATHKLMIPLVKE